MTVPEIVVVGLGNPGDAYIRNRHNVGFMAADAVAAHFGFAPFRKRFEGQIAEGTIAGRAVLLLKPTTYMNESGRAVAAATRFYRIAPEDVVALHDELDLAAGKVRVKRGGGNAGHNGLRSIQARIGADFWRVRIGIGHPGEKERVRGHVLKDFAQTDAEWLRPLLAAIAEQFPLLLNGDAGAFMSKVALAMQPVRESPATPPDRQGSTAKRGDDGL